MIFANKTTFTSDEIEIEGWLEEKKQVDVFIRGDIGTGTVSLLVKSEDGNFYSYPNLVWTQAGAYNVATGTGKYKIDINGATDVTVEVI